MNVEKVNLSEKFGLFQDYWTPHIVGELNDQQVRLAKLKGSFVWHQHDEEDELFLVIEGSLEIQFRDHSVFLEPAEFLIVPRGVEHRPVAREEAHVLLFEPDTTRNTGNVVDRLTVEDPSRI